MVLKAANKRGDSSEQTIARLSDDIGKMADRIGDMADRIGDMSDRILETQRIQSDNLQTTQQTVLKMMETVDQQNRTINRLLDRLEHNDE